MGPANAHLKIMPMARELSKKRFPPWLRHAILNCTLHACQHGEDFVHHKALAADLRVHRASSASGRDGLCKPIPSHSKPEPGPHGHVDLNRNNEECTEEIQPRFQKEGRLDETFIARETECEGRHEVIWLLKGSNSLAPWAITWGLQTASVL